VSACYVLCCAYVGGGGGRFQETFSGDMHN
jgi:hypothetical protein